MKVTVAAVQMACTEHEAENLEKAESLVREAAAAGANIVLLQEMFSSQFFGMQDLDSEYFALASTAEDSVVVRHMSSLAAELEVVLPVSFFERANQAYFNTVAVIGSKGETLGLYRKSHVPSGPPRCFEAYYTSPGNTGFKVWDTPYARIGVGVCWDQWFPECARCLALMGTELIFFPSAIGTDCHDHWQVVQQGHAGANLTPVVAANRVGRESGPFGTTHFWGRSFITDETGAIVAKASADGEEIVTATFDLGEIRRRRADWGVFRDRRPDLYQALLTLDASRAGAHAGGRPE